MFAVDDLLGSAGRDALRQDRLGRLQKNAVPFLRRHFAPALAARTDAELRGAVLAAVPLAERHGFKSESDILSFLIPVVLLGQHFETDPQYGPMLAQAGWIATDGSLVEGPDLAPLLVSIDEHLDAVRSDDAQLQARADGFAALYRQRPDHVDASEIGRWIAALWPARAQWAGERAVQMLALSLQRQMAVLNLPPVDQLALCGLAFRLGHRCIEDPLYGWLAAAVARYADGDDAGREALGGAIIREISIRQRKATA